MPLWAWIVLVLLGLALAAFVLIREIRLAGRIRAHSTGKR